MHELNPRDRLNPPGAKRRVLLAGFAVVLLLGSHLAVRAADPKKAPPKRPRLDLGFAASGEVRRSDEGELSISPWSHRLPARVNVRFSDETRFLRQRKAELSQVAAGDLVLVVEQPPNARERKSRKAWETALKKARPMVVPERIARVRAVIKCWKATNTQVEVEDRQAARALLTGAMPFFRGRGRGSKLDGETALAVGIVVSTEPFSIRTTNGTVKYSVSNRALVIDHEVLPEDAVKSGQTVLVHSSEDVGPDNTVEAALVAVSPRPKLAPERERRLIIRERKKAMAGAG